MPSLPKSPFGRRAARARLASSRAPEREESRVEIVEAPGLRWINIERPRQIDRAWLEERFEFHPLDYEDVYSRNQRPKVDEYDDYLFCVLHFPAYDKSVGPGSSMWIQRSGAWPVGSVAAAPSRATISTLGSGAAVDSPESGPKR